jgi:hypothetical protein
MSNAWVSIQQKNGRENTKITGIGKEKRLLLYKEMAEVIR